MKPIPAKICVNLGRAIPPLPHLHLLTELAHVGQVGLQGVLLALPQLIVNGLSGDGHSVTAIRRG